MSIPRLLNLLRENNTPVNQTFILGEISSINPLKVKVYNIELDVEHLKVMNDLAFQINDQVLLVKVGQSFIILGIVREVL